MCMCDTTQEMSFPFKELGKKFSNWGRWGADDDLGTLNFLTPDIVRKAANNIRSGKRFELSIPLGADGPQLGAGNRHNPIHLMSIMPADFETPDKVCFADDYIMMPLQAASQWDALSHVGYDGLLYNGVSAKTITALGGAARLSPNIKTS